MNIIRTNNTTSTTRATPSNRSEVHRTSPFMRALNGIFNTIQKLTGTSGQKGHSLQPAGKQDSNKMQIIGVQTQSVTNKAGNLRPPAPEPLIRIFNSATSASSKTQVTRPSSPPPPPPIQNPSSATSASSKTQVTRPTSPPPPPPIQNLNSATSAARPTSPPPAPPVLDKTNASQQGPEISAQKENELARPNPSVDKNNETLRLLGKVSQKALINLMFALNERKNNQ